MLRLVFSRETQNYSMRFPLKEPQSVQFLLGATKRQMHILFARRICICLSGLQKPFPGLPTNYVAAPIVEATQLQTRKSRC